MKKCSKCKEEKELTEFAKTGRREGLFSSLCKPCSSAKASAWNKKNKTKRSINSRKNKLKTIYGLTVEALEEMKKAQDGKCAICASSGKMVIDHSHVTGKVRALLCVQCNSGLGFFKDSPEILLKAAEYVKNS